MDPKLNETIATIVRGLSLDAPCAAWTPEGPGPLRPVRFANVLGPALMPMHRLDIDPLVALFPSRERPAIRAGIEASFDRIVALDVPRGPAKSMEIQIGEPWIGSTSVIVWVARKGTWKDGRGRVHSMSDERFAWIDDGRVRAFPKRVLDALEAVGLAAWNDADWHPR